MIRLPRADRPALPLRLLAAALAGVLVIAHTAAVWHEVSVRHVVCAEHGEVVDEAMPAATDGHAPDHHARLDDRAPARDHAPGHAHCGFAALAHGTATAPPAIVAGEAIATARLAPFVPPAPPPPAIAALHLAPKTSPPANASLAS